MYYWLLIDAKEIILVSSWSCAAAVDGSRSKILFYSFDGLIIELIDNYYSDIDLLWITQELTNLSWVIWLRPTNHMHDKISKIAISIN